MGQDFNYHLDITKFGRKGVTVQKKHNKINQNRLYLLFLHQVCISPNGGHHRHRESSISIDLPQHNATPVITPFTGTLLQREQSQFFP